MEQLEKSKQNRVNPVNRVIPGMGSLRPPLAAFCRPYKKGPRSPPPRGQALGSAAARDGTPPAGRALSERNAPARECRDSHSCGRAPRADQVRFKCGKTRAVALRTAAAVGPPFEVQEPTRRPRKGLAWVVAGRHERVYKGHRLIWSSMAGNTGGQVFSTIDR